MRLKRLELFGFKSFADRTTLTFDHTLTGIVGPNGCGKSNVVDAVRWVLGETRPTSMRGGEMADVIFKGSVSRPAMSVAEVTLVLDNTVSGIESHGAEISIARRVYTSGEGEYLIDGERVRLKDVRDMLFDTGLGSRGYAVLEQGRIDAVLSANPVDRRAIFEEAAGISRYRQRRKETESRLKRVEQDMLRLEDVLRELGSRLRSLKIQAGKAERFVSSRDVWRGERGRYVRHRLLEQRRALAALGDELATFDARAAQLRGLREGEEVDAEAREREQRVLSDEVDRQAAEVARLAAEARACDERHAHQLARADSGERVGADESRRALELASSLEVREAELERLREDGLDRAGQLDALEQRLAAERARVAAAAAALEELRKRAEQTNAVALRFLGERTEAHNSVRHLEASRAPLEERARRVDARLHESRRAVEELRERAQACELRLAEAQQTMQGAGERSEGLRVELGEVGANLERAGRERVALELERAKLESRIEALRDWEREREGLEAGARALFAALEDGDGPCSSEDLGGLVADHLSTGTQLARALDTALGASALALVVPDADVAGRLAAWLESRHEGQARLALPEALAPAPARDWRAELGAELPEDLRERVRGALIDEVEVDAGYETLARWLVGDVLVVQDRAAALALVAAHPSWRCVTPAGELVDALGLIVGQREIAQGAIGRRASATELESEVETAAAALAEIDTRIAQLSTRRTALESEVIGAQADFEERRRFHGEVQAEEQTARARLADLVGGLELAERERSHLDEEIAMLERDLETAQARARDGEAGHVEANQALETIEREGREAEQQLQVQRQALGELQSESVGGRAELYGLRQRAGDLERVCGEAHSELERARRLSGEHGEAARAAREEAARVRTEGDRLLSARGEAETRLEVLRGGERAGREAMESFRQRVDAVTRELEDINARLADKRLEEQRIELERAELEGRAQEDLGLGEDDLLEGFEPEPALAEAGALEALAETVGELKRRLDAIGPVNTEAMDELEEAQQRFDFLDAQRTDLESSKKSLDEALKKINEESLRLFTQTFVDVREHFQSLFRQLFGGGRADLILSESDDPLEAGIEITARPPGREMLPIGLLSGGQRTMTALALLFAVFRSRPSPFSVLDEVDAALDDANVGRFLAMLDTFLADTQFLVVTHNKGTMAACDALYGITMETKGVSTHVAVEFGDVDRFVPEAQGDAAKVATARAEVASGGEPDGELREPDESGEPVVELEPQRAPREAEAPPREVQGAAEGASAPAEVGG